MAFKTYCKVDEKSKPQQRRCNRDDKLHEEQGGAFISPGGPKRPA